MYHSLFLFITTTTTIINNYRYMILEMIGLCLPWKSLLKKKTPENKKKIFDMKRQYHQHLRMYLFQDEQLKFPILKKPLKTTSRILLDFGREIKLMGFSDVPNYEKLRNMLVNAAQSERKRECNERGVGYTSATTLSDAEEEGEFTIEFPLSELDDMKLDTKVRCQRWEKRVKRVLKSPVSISRQRHCIRLYDEAENDFDSFFGAEGLSKLSHRVKCEYVELMEQLSWAKELARKKEENQSRGVWVKVKRREKDE